MEAAGVMKVHSFFGSPAQGYIPLPQIGAKVSMSVLDTEKAQPLFLTNLFFFFLYHASHGSPRPWAPAAHSSCRPAPVPKKQLSERLRSFLARAKPEGNEPFLQSTVGVGLPERVLQ